MSWIMAVRAAADTEAANPWDETVINGAPYDACKAIRPAAANPGPVVERPDTQFAEELKRRQLQSMRAR
ncbi:MAG: hypothetical protein ACHP7M_09995 [Burkholderiales bacterium]